MNKAFIGFLFWHIGVMLFCQSQFVLDIVHDRSDFHVFRSDSVPSDTMKFYNESSHISNVDFINAKNEDDALSLSFKPFSYTETKYTKTSFEISEIFGQITIETYMSGLPVRTFLGDDIIITNSASKITLLRYSDNDIYLMLHSGKISIQLGKTTLILIAGESIVLHRSGTYDYIDKFDPDLCRHKLVSDIIANRQQLLNDVILRMSNEPDTASLEYRRLWIWRRFLADY